MYDFINFIDADFFFFFSYLDVPLDVFMNFNKIKELANGTDEIQKAIDISEILELSSDRQSVRRITEIKKKDDIDEYTVYVVIKDSFIFFVHEFMLNLQFD